MSLFRVFFLGGSLLNGELGKTVFFFRELLKWEFLFCFFWENIPDTDADSKSP